MTTKIHGKDCGAQCPECLSKNVLGMSRVVGYYSIIENWNDSKQAEFADRQNGKYQIGECGADTTSLVAATEKLQEAIAIIN